MFARAPASVSIVTLEPVVLLTLEARRLAPLVERFPAVATRLVRELARRPAPYELVDADRLVVPVLPRPAP